MPKKFLIEFDRIPASISSKTTKLGGQPAWYSSPQWPLSRKTSQPMLFLGQVALDPVIFGESEGRMAYLFMSDNPSGDLATMDPMAGENAVVVQPGGYDGSFSAQLTGPPWQQQASGIVRRSKRAVEFGTRLTLGEDPEWQDVIRGTGTDRELYKRRQSLLGSKIGGTPAWIYEPQLPLGGPWRLLLQLESGAPLDLGLGDAGVLYALISEKGNRGAMLWQTH